MPEDYLQKMIEAHQAGLEYRRQQQLMQQQQEDHQLTVQQKKLEYDNAKLIQKAHENELAKMQAEFTSAQPGQTTPDTRPENILPAVGTPGAPNYQPSEPLGGTQVLPNAPIQFQGANGPFNFTPPTLQEQQQRATQAQAAAIQQEAAKASAIAAAQAPFARTEQAPGAQTIVGAGTPQQTVIPGPPAKAPEPTMTPEVVTINGKGPYPAILVKQGESFKYLDPNTHQPIQGTIGHYERPRETAPPEELPTVDELTRTTSSGNTYADVNKFTGKAKNAATTAAIKAHLPVPTEKEITQLNSMDAARADADYMLQQLNSKLAVDPVSRLTTGGSNVISKLSQGDPVLGAVGTFQSAAARQLLALGATGRLNPTLLDVAIKNDIPQITDTIDTARQRVQNLKRFFDDAERAILGSQVAKKPAANGSNAIGAATQALIDKYKKKP